MANGAQERIRARSTTLTGKNAHRVMALEPHEMQPAFNVGERDGSLYDM
jgi:hypothetical protein